MAILRSPLVQKPYQIFHYYFLSEKRPGSTLADLDFETSPSKNIHKFKQHKWTIQEAIHYMFLTSVILFVYIVFPANILIKTLILSVFTTCFLIPLTSQFFVHALPIFAWLALYFTCGKIPNSWKPDICVKVLPALETILYGDNLSAVLATITNSYLDIVAWLPYGIIHFSAPFVVAAFIFIFAPPTSLRSYGFAFGYMNLFGVITQIMFPAAPPWYKILHGLEPADYSMSGSPGGLGRIDELLGVDMYTTTFSNSPVIFGAFPSLHSGCSVMDVFFLCWLFPKLFFVWWGYALWLWWSTMYLTHHYFIDLIGGAALSLMVFTYTKYMHLPLINHNKFCRWSYTQIEKIDITNSDPLVNYQQVDDLESGGIQLQNLATSSQSNQAPVQVQAQPQPLIYNNQMYKSDISTRSRQSPKSYLASNSSVNLMKDEDTKEDVSSFDQSAGPSVFEGEGRSNSSNGSQTSLDDLDDLRQSSKRVPV